MENSDPPAVTGPFNISLAPTISLLTSIPDEWYQSRSLTFAWTIPRGRWDISGYSYVFDNKPGTEPDDIIDTTENIVTISNVVDGVWYFHVKARSRGGAWSDTAHMRVEIPNPFMFVYPVDGGFVTDNRPTLDWAYTMNIYGDPVTLSLNGPVSFTRTGLTSSSYKVAGEEVLPDGVYTWRVGTWLWSDNWQFVVDTDSSISSVTMENGWRNSIFFTVPAEIREPVTAIDRMELWYRYSADNVNWGGMAKLFYP